MNNWENERLFMKMNVGDRQKEQGQVMANKCALLDQELVNERFEWINEHGWMN